MAGANVQITLDDMAVQAAFSRLLARSDDLRPTFAALGDYLLETTQQRFVDEQGPNNKDWDDLSPTTLALKTKNRDLILTEHGGLQDNLHYNESRQALEFGSNDVYAAMMQFGGTTSPRSAFPNKKIPARPFLGVNAADEQALRRVVFDSLNAALNSTPS